jgi:hypothetical protein
MTKNNYMPEFNVKWNGFETNSDSPLEAAIDALSGISFGTARVFLVQNQTTGECFSVDLDEEEGNQVQTIAKEEFEKDQYSVKP